MVVKSEASIRNLPTSVDRPQLHPPHSSRKTRIALLLSASWLMLTGAATALAADAPVRDTFGETGILDMPDARMTEDGELAFTVGGIGRNQRFNLTFQALPWLEGAFRFSALSGFYYDRSFSAKIRLWQESTYLPDLSVGFRDLLGTGVYSSEYVVASKRIGTFDLTGGFGWGRLADRSTFKNPLGEAFTSFKSRGGVASNGAGGIEFGKFFHGENVGTFGGVVWQTPIAGLKVLGEYSSDEYTYDARYAKFTYRSPVNLGLSYAPFNNLSFSAGWMYGNTYAFTVVLRGNPKDDLSAAQRVGPALPEIGLRNPEEQYGALVSVLALRNDDVAKRQLRQDISNAFSGVRDIAFKSSHVAVTMANGDAPTCTGIAALVRKSGITADTVILSAENAPASAVCSVLIQAQAQPLQLPQQPALTGLANTTQAVVPETTPDAAALEQTLAEQLLQQGLVLRAVRAHGAEIWVYYQNGRYNKESDALARVMRILTKTAPSSVEYFHLVPVANGVPTQNFTVVRSAFERAFQTPGSNVQSDSGFLLEAAPMDNPEFEAASKNFYPQWSWSVDPKMTEHVFDPDDPMQFMFYASASAVVEPARGWALSSAWTANIWNDYNFNRGAGSALPHVRTDLMEYVRKSPYGMSSMMVDYRTRITPEVFASARIGYLEDMYAGLGGQVLWRPDGSRFAFGADLYQVWKRGFTRMWSLQDYNVTTGHVSVYYQSPWYGLNFNVHVGRYLARDYGATFEITRRFSSGVEVGFFSTFTNVPFDKFGEGRFDKGLILRIPLQWALPISSQSSYDLHMSSLTRDGGQRLANDDSLYDETERTSYGEISRHFSEILSP